MRKRRKRSAFVPTVVFGTAVASVVPACALGCGGDTQQQFGVALAFDAANPPDGGDSGLRDAPAFGVADVSFGVGAVAFCGFCDAAPDVPGDAPKDAPDDGSGDGPQGG